MKSLLEKLSNNPLRFDTDSDSLYNHCHLDQLILAMRKETKQKLGESLEHIISQWKKRIETSQEFKDGHYRIELYLEQRQLIITVYRKEQEEIIHPTYEFVEVNSVNDMMVELEKFEQLDDVADKHFKEKFESESPKKKEIYGSDYEFYQWYDEVDYIKSIFKKEQTIEKVSEYFGLSVEEFYPLIYRYLSDLINPEQFKKPSVHRYIVDVVVKKQKRAD